MSEGYLLCSFGYPKYHKLAIRMILEIRKFDKERPIAILTDNKSFFEKENILVIDFDYKKHLHKNIDEKNDWNKFGLIPKIYQYKYSPFDITCFMDVDMLFYKDFTFIWHEFKKQNKTILIGGKCDKNNKSPSNWHWGNIDNVIKNCGYNCPQICGTIFIYNKEFLKEENIINNILVNIKNYKVKNLFNNGCPDEIIYSLILGKLKIYPSELLDKWFYNKQNCDSCNKII